MNLFGRKRAQEAPAPPAASTVDSSQKALAAIQMQDEALRNAEQRCVVLPENSRPIYACCATATFYSATPVCEEEFYYLPVVSTRAPGD